MSNHPFDRSTFRRKLVYLVLIATLLVPLSRLSQPAIVASAQRPADPGGVLAQKRDEYRLGQANLGKIDPASETIKLATFGLRGVAATLMWNKAEEYKMKKDWTRLSAAYQQIIYLQPNYVDVWRFQAGNLAYNISYEFDDYRDRYHWVTRGIEFLEEGLTYNEGEPRLLSTVGHIASHKLGRSDERRQFRALFREDDDFHARQQVHERDNFMFALAYFREAERVVEDPRDNILVLKSALTPLIFFSQSTMAQVEYAKALEDDHAAKLAAIVDRKARQHLRGTDHAEGHEAQLREVDETFAARITAAWQATAAAWQRYCERTFYTIDGRPFRFVDLPTYDAELKELVTKLDAYDPGLRERIVAEKRAALSDAERRALDRPEFERTDDDRRLAEAASDKLYATHEEVGERITGPHADEAREVGKRAMSLLTLRNEVEAQKEPNNVDYWIARCQLEQQPEARDARRQIHRGTVAYREADLKYASRELDAGFHAWRKVLDAHPELLDDPSSLLMYEAIHEYEETLKQLDLPFPAKFVLDDVRRAVDHVLGVPSKGQP
jgi:hypothetical protein